MATAITRRITAGDAVIRALQAQGLPAPTVVSASSEPNAIQMWALLRECGQDLLGKFNWQNLTETYVFTTVAGQLLYPLPEDFERFIDNTAWNVSSKLPMVGAVNNVQWKGMQVRSGNTNAVYYYTINGDHIQFSKDPGNGINISMDYISRGWLIDGSNATILRDAPNADTDIIKYDPRLIVAYLKFKFREAKGFDTAAADREYQMALEDARGKDAPRRVLRIGGRSRFPFLGVNNLPDTGYGI
jgi:hypothetical protein